MPLPDYEQCMLPLLRLVEDGNVYVMRDLTQRLADHFELTEDERQQMLPSGQAKYITNRVAWSNSLSKYSARPTHAGGRA
jgi:restriction system protein